MLDCRCRTESLACKFTLYPPKQIALWLLADIINYFVQGLRLDISTKNRMGLLADITRLFRENGLSVSRSEIGTNGDRAIGSFYVTDASGHEVDAHTIELVRQEIGGSVLVVNESSGKLDNRSRVSLASLLWSHLERISSNFSPIRP